MAGWHIPRMWEGGECWIIGGGPSMPKQFGVPEDVIAKVMSKELPLSAFSPYLSPIHDKHVIGVNAAFLLGSWIDVMCWGDGSFYWKNKDEILKFRGLKISVNPNTQPGRPGVYDSKFVQRDGNMPFGISKKPNMVSWNKHTGGAAINLAYHFGVKKIFLLGFDMVTDPKTDHQHWHSHYSTGTKPRKPNQLPFGKHLSSFKPIKTCAQNAGIAIYNVSMGSAIVEFPKVTLEEALNIK
jgi:hypothetical protein